jgi:predicted outer membrane protein
MESKNAKDPALKSFVTETLPTLKNHLKEAKSIAPKPKTASTASSGGMK